MVDDVEEGANKASYLGTNEKVLRQIGWEKLKPSPSTSSFFSSSLILHTH